jgi:uncharacterized protein YjbJ (UPF0337 family)
MSGEISRKPITSTTDDMLNAAVKHQQEEHGPSDAAVHIVKFEETEGPGGSGSHGVSGGRGSGGDDDKWKVIGGVLAAVAVIALGTVAIKKKSGGKKEQAHEEASGLVDEAARKLRGSGRWIGDRAETVKDKAGNATDDIGPRVQGAASSTKETLSNVVPSGVKNAASTVGDKANIAGIKAEREGLKASERSDAAVRDAADKVIHNTNKVAGKADRKTGGFFSGIGNWFSDRKGDASDALDKAGDKVQGK